MSSVWSRRRDHGQASRGLTYREGLSALSRTTGPRQYWPMRAQIG